MHAFSQFHMFCENVHRPGITSSFSFDEFILMKTNRKLGIYKRHKTESLNMNINLVIFENIHSLDDC